MTSEQQELKAFLDAKVKQYNTPDFIANDPITLPHSYKLKQDIEISGLFAAVLAWGQRKTIINKCRNLMARMDNAPYDFAINHKEEDLKKLVGFCHRTFNDTDLLYFIQWLKHFYTGNDSLEVAFLPNPEEEHIGPALARFHESFFSLPDAPNRTRKHIATPARNSACKRLSMYLRWMVRHDDRGVDFGIWEKISPAKLICPCDVHVDRVARTLNLVSRKQTDWRTAVELTANLKQFDAEDPVKYDYALFGLGIEEAFGK